MQQPVIGGRCCCRRAGVKRALVPDHLIQAVRAAHGSLQVQALDVLPVLLQQGDQEIDRHLSVNKDLLVSHGHVADSDTHAQNLLQLELNRRLNLVNLDLERLVVGDEGGELAGLVQTRTKQTRNHLDDRLGGKEGLVLLGQLLHQLLVLVKLLQLLNVECVHTDAGRLLAMLHIPEHAQLHLRASHERKLHGAAETLVLLGIIVLQTDLQLNGLSELPLLLLGSFQDGLDSVLEGIA
mmetsp:Transcript_15986/g.28434  ORF Transcript_15986/g.28434 Transcript_15986/m.28434 type:complete len:238 (-) Transcript_15986:94-807(-)